jgi:two-component system response regulator ResD
MSGAIRVILIVEDEPSISEVISLYLRRAGYQVAEVRDGQAALDFLAKRTVDLVVLDLMLPAVDGLEVTKRVRLRSDTPIIMLTARGAEADRILGLELGADDYVVKPFSPQELVSRVRAILRRARAESGGVSVDPPLVYDGLTIDPATRLVTVDGVECVLTTREFDLLWVLASHPRRAFNREQLLGMAWGSAEFIDPSTVTVHVRRLREKIERDPSEPRHIVTVWGLGYRFDP